MNNGKTAPTPVSQHDSTEAASETRLTGWHLLLARVVALSVISVTVLLGIVALVNWPRLAQPCEAALNACLMTPEQVAPLARLGVTPEGLALGVVLLCCAAIALANTVATLLLWRRSDDAMALLVAVTLVLLPAFFTPMYQALPGAWRATGEVLSNFGGACFLLLVLLFPSGRFAPRWLWAPVALTFGLVFTVGQQLPTAIALPLVLLCALSFYRWPDLSLPPRLVAYPALADEVGRHRHRPRDRSQSTFLAASGLVPRA